MLDSVNGTGQAAINWSQLTHNKHTSREDLTMNLPGNKANAEEVDLTIGREKVNKEIAYINDQLEALNHSLRMRFSEEAEQFYVEVVDRRTSEVIESIPGKHMIELASKLKDMIGFFIDEKR